jgi:hypothetical protein
LLFFAVEILFRVSLLFDPLGLGESYDLSSIGVSGYLLPVDPFFMF